MPAKLGNPSLFERLSLDILVQIQSCVDPCDIISLRQTCKTISIATQQRTVWSDALRRLCVNNGIFEPSFPLERMTQRELEHAATSPSRFATLLMNPNGAIHPLVTRILDIRPTSDDGELFDCRLIPGGRFLVTNSDNGTMHLWDLGFSAGAMIKPFPLASMKGAKSDILAIHPTGDRAGIRLFLSYGYEQQEISICVYELYPLSNFPTFIMIVSLENLGQIPKLFAASTDLIAILQDTLVTVWNFMLNSAVTWAVSAREDTSSLLIFKNQIILFDAEGFTLWNIPPLQPHAVAGVFTPVSSPQTPVWTFTHPQRDKCNQLIALSNSWHPETRGTMHFNVSAFVHSHSIAYYSMKPSCHEHDMPDFIPVLMVWTETQGFVGGAAYGEMSAYGNWLIQPWIEAEKIAVNITRAPTTRREETLTKTLFLWTPHRASDTLDCYDLCPISGRLCCSVNENRREIRVMDYMVPGPLQ